MPYNRITVYNTYAELISVTVRVEEVQQMQRAWIEKFRAKKSLNLAGSSFLSFGALACFPLHGLLKEGRRISRVWAYSPSKETARFGETRARPVRKVWGDDTRFRTDTPSLAF